MWRRATPIVVAVLALSMAYSATAGQLGYWAFDEGTGTTAKDSSGKNNNGTARGRSRLGERQDWQGPAF